MSMNGEDSMYQFETDEIGDSNHAADSFDDRSLEDNGLDNGLDDPELEAIKARVREMEEEAEKIKAMQSEVEKQMNLSAPSIGSPTTLSIEERLDADSRSVWIGNVDYSATAEELEEHFNSCGSVNRVTILCDKFTGHPKGFAYVEFSDRDSASSAMALDDSLFRGRQIKVTLKRTNKHGISSTNRPPRGRGFSRPPRFSYPTAYPGYAPRFPRGRGYRSRRPYFSPY